MGGSKNKAGYFDKLKGLLEQYKSVFVVEIDNVSSQQMHEIRHALRGEGVVLMGKNTMVGTSNLTRTIIGLLLGQRLTLLRFVGSTCPEDIRRRHPRLRASPASRQG